MPGIFLREGYLESKRVASLANNPLAERFYFHLLLVVDENGIFEADPVLLKNRCFPAIDNIRTTDVSHWIADCETAGLVRLFEDAVAGKQCVEVLRHNPLEKGKKASRYVFISPNDGKSILPFAEFWELFGKKVEREKCIRKYAKLTEEERTAIKAMLPAYVKSTPDLKFRKNPQTWLNGRCWEDEMNLLPSGSKVTSEMRKRKGF